MLNKGMMTSDKADWGTPAELYARLDNMFSFTLDAAANQYNTKCAQFLSEKTDALMMLWQGSVWLNPPYGRGLPIWMEKCAFEKKRGTQIVTLVPARPDTRWFRIIWDQADAVCFIYGRLRFEGQIGATSAPFPSALAFFGHSLTHQQELELAQIGKVVK